MRRLHPADPPERLPLRLLAAASVLGRYVRVGEVGSYAVTLGGVAAAAVLLASLREVRLPLAPLAIAAALLLWPLLLFLGASLAEAALLPTPDAFLQSYALWAASVALIGLAFLSTRPLQLPGSFALASMILLVAGAQWLVAGLAGSLAGFELVAPLLGIDLVHGYLRMEPGWGVRAIGLYYEPSMCGRVLGTLAFIDFLQHRRAMRAAGVLLAALLLTKSLGLLVLAAAIGTILLGRSRRGALALASLAVLVAGMQGAAIEQRLRNDAAVQAEASTYRRTVAPLAPVAETLAAYPAGVAIGAAELVAAASGYAERTGEAKITNGIYEFLLYFGVMGAAALAAALLGIAALMLAGRREAAAALLYLLLSTAISGSFLSVESSLLTYYFVAACRAAARPCRPAAETNAAMRAAPARRPAWGPPAGAPL